MRARAKVYARNSLDEYYRHKLARHADPRGQRKFRQCDVQVDAFELDCSQKAFFVLEDLYRACAAGSMGPNYSFLARQTSICTREQDKRRGRGKTDRPDRKHGRKEGRKGGREGAGAYLNSPPPSPLPLAREQPCLSRSTPRADKTDRPCQNRSNYFLPTDRNMRLYLDRCTIPGCTSTPSNGK
jgi:hypothetical protein